MFKILNEYYYFDLDMIDEHTRIESTQVKSDSNSEEGTAEEDVDHAKVHLVKYELIKFMLEIVMEQQDEVDEKLVSSTNELSIPFKLAFNSLLTKKIINKY
jgi:hypothetical protein